MTQALKSVEHITESRVVDNHWQPSGNNRPKIVNRLTLANQKKINLLRKYPFYFQDLPTLPRVDTIPKDVMDFKDELNNDQLTDYKISEIKEYARLVNSISIQTDNIEQGKTYNGLDFDGTYLACNNFYAGIEHIVRIHLYDILPSKPILELKTPRHQVMHSLGHTGLHSTPWYDRLRFLVKFPNRREESCYSQGKAAGDMVLVLSAEVRQAYSRDVTSQVNPFTGEKITLSGLSEKGSLVDTDPEMYFQNKPPHEKHLHSLSDELFCRFDVNQDLKAIEVWYSDDEDIDSKLIQIRKVIKKLGLKEPEIIARRYK